VRSLVDKCVRGSIILETEVNVLVINKYFPQGIILFILFGRSCNSEFCNQKHFVIPLTVEVAIRMWLVS
jgi:hypothetical protein